MMHPALWLSMAALICVAGMLCCLFMLYRNQKVYAYRMNLIQKIGDKDLADIEAGRDRREYCWRFEDFDTVSYDAQMYQFWRRFDDFLPPRLREDLEVA